MTQSPEKCLKIWIKLLEEVWKEKDSRKEFIKNPLEFLVKHEVKVPKGITLKVHENTDQVRFLTLPQRPEKELAPEAIDIIAAGWGQLFLPHLQDYKAKPGNTFKPSKWTAVVQEAWADSAFKQELLENPDSVLKAKGLDLQKVTCKIHENEATHWHLTLPLKPERKLYQNGEKTFENGELFLR